MSKRQQTNKGPSVAQSAPRAGDGGKDATGIVFKPALKPQRKLFVALMVVLILWIGVLVGLYVKTVYGPRRVNGSTTAAVR